MLRGNEDWCVGVSSLVAVFVELSHDTSFFSDALCRLCGHSSRLQDSWHWLPRALVGNCFHFKVWQAPRYPTHNRPAVKSCWPTYSSIDQHRPPEISDTPPCTSCLQFKRNQAYIDIQTPLNTTPPTVTDCRSHCLKASVSALRLDVFQSTHWIVYSCCFLLCFEYLLNFVIITIIIITIFPPCLKS